MQLLSTLVLGLVAGTATAGCPYAAAEQVKVARGCPYAEKHEASKRDAHSNGHASTHAKNQATSSKEGIFYSELHQQQLTPLSNINDHG
jgi:hypothetical protein